MAGKKHGQTAITAFGRWSITTALIGTFGALVVAVLAASQILMVGVASENTRNLVAERSVLVVEGVRAEIRKHMVLARQQVESLAAMAHRGELDIDDEKRLFAVMEGSLSGLPEDQRADVHRQSPAFLPGDQEPGRAHPPGGELAGRIRCLREHAGAASPWPNRLGRHDLCGWH